MSVTFTASAPLPCVAVTVSFAVPLPTAFTLPSASTVATFLSEEAHANVTFSAFSGVIFAVAFVVSPTFRSAFLTDAFTPVSTTGFSGSGSVPPSFITVTSTVAVFVTAPSPLPCVAVTVSVAVPSATALTFPSLSTVAILSSEDVHASSTPSAPSGMIVAVAFVVSPTFSSAFSTDAFTPVSTGFSGSGSVPPSFITVTSTVAVFVTAPSPLPCVAVTVSVAVPSATALTFPSLSTVAILSSEDVHASSTPSAPSGMIVAVAFVVSPTFSSAFSTDAVTPVSTGFSGSSGLSGRMIAPPSFAP